VPGNCGAIDGIIIFSCFEPCHPEHGPGRAGRKRADPADSPGLLRPAAGERHPGAYSCPEDCHKGATGRCRESYSAMTDLNKARYSAWMQHLKLQLLVGNVQVSPLAETSRPSAAERQEIAKKFVVPLGVVWQ